MAEKGSRHLGPFYSYIRAIYNWNVGQHRMPFVVHICLQVYYLFATLCYLNSLWVLLWNGTHLLNVFSVVSCRGPHCSRYSQGNRRTRYPKLVLRVLTTIKLIFSWHFITSITTEMLKSDEVNYTHIFIPWNKYLVLK